MSSPKKTYVLDTNVLLHDPQSIFKFDEHNVAIPVEVLSELDHKKTAPGVVGANARQVNRELRRLFDGRKLENLVEGSAGDVDTLVVPLEHGGQIRIVVNEQLVRHHLDGSRLLERLYATFINIDEPDHRIIATTLYLRDRHTTPVVLVTKDACMALKAKALGLDVEDYRNDRVETDETGEYAAVHLSTSAMREFSENGRVTLNRLSKGGNTLYVNEYVMLDFDGWSEPACYVGDKTFRALPLYREFHSPEAGTRKGVQLPRGVRVIPKNHEQWIFMDALLDPEIRLVTCFGRAGTGKTFISIAAALSQVLSDFTQYKKLYISRPVVQIGKDIGALPGTKEDKLSPYIQPYFDNLEVLFSQQGHHAENAGADGAFSQTKRQQKKHHANPARIFGHGNGTGGGASAFGGGASTARKPYQWLLDSGLIEIEAMTFIRGRSIGNAFMIVDEAQNMTPHEAKTVITRIAEGSKLVLIGDLDQVDTPYLDNKSNGLIHAHEHLKGHAITAHVRLLRGVRSHLSELAAQCM
ncbi:MAG: PhoH family protein [Puniceicoccales bacterium]|jgi:PhoH-like ATPase|nr:PhoH family protein [Puniceicoccales bacterium]